MFVFTFTAMDGVVVMFQEKTVNEINKRLLEYLLKEDRDLSNQLDAGSCWELYWADSNGLTVVGDVGLHSIPQFIVD